MLHIDLLPCLYIPTCDIRKKGGSMHRRPEVAQLVHTSIFCGSTKPTLTSRMKGLLPVVPFHKAIDENRRHRPRIQDQRLLPTSKKLLFTSDGIFCSGGRDSSFSGEFLFRWCSCSCDRISSNVKKYSSQIERTLTPMKNLPEERVRQ
jgi:hypothetical protein